MAPGRLSRDGFLGADERTLDDIIGADLATLEAAGLEPHDIADLLDELHESADEALEGPKELYDGKVKIRETEVRGSIPCPFACAFRTHKANIEVTADGMTLLLTPLSAHMIREHGFFQGKGSPFRLEPTDLIRLYRICRGR
jgi:hypothetical protein